MTPPNRLKAAAGALNEPLGDFTATWADSDGAGTEGGPIDIDPGDDLPASGQYLVLVHNPSGTNDGALGAGDGFTAEVRVFAL